MSSQSVTMPCSSGYRILSSPRSSVAAFWPMNTSPSNAPASTRRCFGLPTHDGKWHFGTSSPAKPARMVPDPLSSTMGALCSVSAMVCTRIRECYCLNMQFSGVFANSRAIVLAGQCRPCRGFSVCSTRSCYFSDSRQGD
jgi:hypothetical protein